MDRLNDTRAALAEMRAAADSAMELLEQIEHFRLHGDGDRAQEDEAALRVSLRAMGEALIDLAGRAS